LSTTLNVSGPVSKVSLATAVHWGGLLALLLAELMAVTVRFDTWQLASDGTWGVGYSAV